MERKMISEKDLINLKDTELRLGLPGSGEFEKQSAPAIRKNKRPSPDQMAANESTSSTTNSSSASISHPAIGDQDAVPQSKAQVIGWPPVRSYRRNSLSTKQGKKGEEVDGGGIFVKVSMDGAPYLRKMDLKLYGSYSQLLMALENMFQFKIGEHCEKEGFNGPDLAPTYEDKDGDWMLVGDVPWEMFISSCKKLRIMKGSEARGLGCSSN